jgi:hypothetical protein
MVEFHQTALLMMLKEELAMAGIPDELPRFVQIKIRRMICNKLTEYLKDFDPENLFDGIEEQAFASAYYTEEVLEELISTISTCK